MSEENEWDFHFNGVGEAFSIFLQFLAEKHGDGKKEKSFRKVLLLFLSSSSSPLSAACFNKPSKLLLRKRKIDIVRPSKANNLFLSFRCSVSVAYAYAYALKPCWGKEIKFGSFGKV